MKPIFSIFNFLKGLKTTKFLEVPSGTAIKMYGKDADDNLVEDDVPSGGATAFTELSDVPQSYTDQAGKMLVVNDDEDALEFINTTEISDGHTHSNKTDLDNYDPDDFALVGHNHNLNDLTEKSYNSLTDKPTIPTAFTDLSDVPQSYTDQAGKMLVVNEGETALEFTESHIIADARASHFQMTPATNVEVPHNLGKIPSVVFTYYSSGVSFACDWEPLASDPLNVIICKPAEAMMFKVYFN